MLIYSCTQEQIYSLLKEVSLQGDSITDLSLDGWLGKRKGKDGYKLCKYQEKQL